MTTAAERKAAAAVALAAATAVINEPTTENVVAPESSTEQPVTEPVEAPVAGTAVLTWEEEMAAAADEAAAQEAGTATGQFFSVKAGVLTWDDQPLPQNRMAVVILDTILENVFYAGRYDPDTQTGPLCFAFGRGDEEMKPHEDVLANESDQHDQCEGCPMNQYKTADNGKGKACRNSRRLALIPAGTFDKNGVFELNKDPDHYAGATMGFLRLPVMSVKGYSGYVKTIAATLRRPPLAVVTMVSVVPDAQSQFRVVFEPIMNLPNEVMTAIMARNREAKATIDFPYALDDGSAARAAAAKPVATKPEPRRKY